MKLLLDTHTWIWWHMAPQKLSRRVLRRLRAPDSYDALLLSAISVWEFSKLIEKGRLRIAIDGQAWIRAALQMPKLRIVELEPDISWNSTRLPEPFHDDPADQIIVATARQEGAVLLTKDRAIREYPHVKCFW